MALSSRYTTATAFLEHASTADFFSYTVPTSAPIDQSAPPPTLAQEDHALATSTWFSSHEEGGQSTGFVLSRIVEDAYTLELRWCAFSRTARQKRDSMDHDGAGNAFEDLDEHSGTLPPVRFTFPSRLVPTPSFVVTASSSINKQLEIYCLTEAGYLYVLTFPLTSLFYAVEGLGLGEWSDEYKVESLEGRTPVLVQGVDEGRCVVGCADGFAVCVELVEGNDAGLVETELRMPSSFSVRSLIPSFSTRNLTSPTKGTFQSASSLAAPNQLLSVACVTSATDPDSPASTFAFGVTRDRKLRIWSLESGACFRAIDLPRAKSSSNALTLASSNSSIDSPRASRNDSLLSPAPQALVKLVHGSDLTSYPAYLALFSPASSASPAAFILYGLATDASSGELSELEPVAERSCPSGSIGNLVDFGVARMDLAGDASWTLWTCWDEGGETEIRTIGVSELDAQAIATVEDEWIVVERGTVAKTATWTAAYFDDQLRDSPASVADTVLRHISFPGRYPPATLDHALQQYEELILSELENDGVPAPAQFGLEYATQLERAAAIVGSTVILQQCPQTGAFLHDEYNKQLKIEWLRFVAMLNESRSVALYPTCLALDEARGIAAVFGRDSVTVPIVREAVHALRSLSTPQQILAAQAEPESLLDLPPALSADYTLRSDILPLLAIIRDLQSRLTTNNLRTLESLLLEQIRAPFTADMEDTALDLFDKSLEPALPDDSVAQIVAALKGLDSSERAVDTFLRLLISEQLSPIAASAADDQPASDLSNALLADALSTSIETRYELAKGLVAVLLVVWVGEDEEAVEADVGVAPVAQERLFARLDQTTAAALTTLHALAAMQWIAAELASPSAEALTAVQKQLGASENDGVLERFGELRMKDHDGADVIPVPTYGLLSALLRTPDFAASLLPASRSSLPVALAFATASVFRAFGILPSSTTTQPESSTAATIVGMRLQQLALPAQAAEWVELWPKTAGMSYVRGRALLDLLDGDGASEALEKAASGLYGVDLLEDDDTAAALLAVLPSGVGSSLARYYQHVVSLHVPTSFDAAIARFAQLALDALTAEDLHDEVAEKDMWIKLFRSYAALTDYVKAYEVVMAAPHHETQMTCLAHFISVVCENGSAFLLTTFSFSGLEADLERNLAFRARNSDPLARPNYYRVLYAYHAAKGDYRSAGTVMYQQGRRLGELSTKQLGSYRDIATLQCQSYLAAANALSLVAREHAWLAVVEDDASERSHKRRKLVYHIPEDEFEPSVASPQLEVLHVNDIRKEYCIALSRLQLSAEFPELERTNFHLDPDSVVALFSQIGNFEQAFWAGRVLNVDLSSLFEVITERCVTLAQNPEGAEDASWVAMSSEAPAWEGSLSSKAWRLLERHLERHDREVGQRYRLVVLERTLALNRGGKIPPFLTDHIKLHNLPALLRTLIKYDRLDEAFTFSLEVLKSAQPPTTPFSTIEPWSLYDQLLAIPSGDSASFSDDVLKQRQVELREALNARLAALAKADKQVRKA
ncbi:nuclear pore complex protein Nup160 [Rhodotorula toruloides]|uniref:Nuclear pore complex protein Nup160 n=1 Tax=Rhodotorula toruloides TaxID=5286 RepID=A0A511K808_RHOTO|nr:nuclear pore complex protein Nup160 [Rhodotorula toruloides]